MVDQITFEETADGIRISISGVGGILGFLELAISSKFQPGLSWKYLLSPYTNEIINLLIKKLREDPRFKDKFPLPYSINGNEVKSEIKKLVRANKNRNLTESDLLSVAMFPYD